MPARVVLIDSDTLVYAAALSTERPVEWEDGLWTLHALLPEGIDRLEGIVATIREHLQPDRIVMTLSDSNSKARWRNAVMPTYKEGRKVTRRPLTYRPLREYVHESFDTFERPGLEGDDVMGILATKSNPENEERIIVSIDKDMKTIPGKLFNYDKPENGILEITEDEANWWHLFQTLTGDRTDGYPGCPGIGEVTARKLLEPCWFTLEDEQVFDTVAAWAVIEKAYRKAGLGEDVALMNAQVARILRAEDYDFKKHTPILWTP